MQWYSRQRPNQNRKKVETHDINFNHNISDPVDFRIYDSVDINGARNSHGTFFDRIDNTSNIESNKNPLDTYKYSVNEDVLLKTSRKNEFISIATAENVTPKSRTSFWWQILWRTKSPTFVPYWKIWVSIQ